MGYGYEVSISSEQVKQGGVLAVKIEDLNPKAKYTCSLDKRNYPLYVYGNNKLWAIIGISVGLEQGKHKIKITEILNNVKSNKEYYADVLSGGFRKETVKFTEEKQDLISSPKMKQESNTISNALKTEEETQLWKGNFIIPCKGKITGEFGSSRYDKYGDLLWYHKGVDFGVKIGTPVIASNDGYVTLARKDFEVNGRTVSIDHGQGISTIYIHLENVEVQEGQKVEKGDWIGSSGSTGIATGPNLHWGLYVHGVAVNPMDWTENAPQ